MISDVRIFYFTILVIETIRLILWSRNKSYSSNDQWYGISFLFSRRNYSSSFRNTSCRRRWLIHPFILSFILTDRSKNQFILTSLCYRRTWFIVVIFVSLSYHFDPSRPITISPTLHFHCVVIATSLILHYVVHQQRRLKSFPWCCNPRWIQLYHPHR